MNKYMAQKLEENEIVPFKEIQITNSIQMDVLAQLLIDEGIITQEKIFNKVKQVQASYQKTEPIT